MTIISNGGSPACRCVWRVQKCLSCKLYACMVLHCSWIGLGCCTEGDKCWAWAIERSRHAADYWKRNSWRNFNNLKSLSKGKQKNIWMKPIIKQSQRNTPTILMQTISMDGRCVKPLPVSGFKWMSDFDNWKIIPCILEVDLEYPKELHDLHNDYPLAPERLMINKVENLITNDKEKYVIHHKNLTEYLDLGLGIKKIHRGITFKEEPWLEKYIKH